MAEPAIGPGIRGDLHRRDQREDPRGPGRQPPHLPGPGRHRGRRARRAGPVGRRARRRRGRQVLAAGPVRDQEPRRRRRVHAGLRRAQGPARCGEHGLGEDDRANMYRASPAEFLQVRLEEGLGADRERPQARLHRGIRIRGAGPVRRIQRQMGKALPRYHPALGERVGGIRALPAVRPGNQDRHLHDKCHRVDQCPAAAGGQRPRPLPDRAGRADSTGQRNTGWFSDSESS